MADPRLKAAADELSSVVQAQRGEEKFSVIVDFMVMEVNEETFDGGEIGRTEVLRDESDVGTFDSADEAVKKIASLTGLPEGHFHAVGGRDDGMIEATGLVDVDNMYVGDDNSFITRWKAGEVKAWNMTVSAFLRFARTWQPSADEFRKAGLKVE